MFTAHARVRLVSVKFALAAFDINADGMRGLPAASEWPSLVAVVARPHDLARQVVDIDRAVADAGACLLWCSGRLHGSKDLSLAIWPGCSRLLSLN
jgi:hypothetical protein